MGAAMRVRGVVRLDAEEEGAEEAGGEERQGEAGGDAGEEEGGGVAEDEGEDVGAPGAEGQAEAESSRVRRVTRYARRAVEAGEGDEEGEATEGFEQVGGEELRAHGVFDDFVHGLDFGVGEVGVGGDQGVAELGEEAAGIAAGTEEDFGVGFEGGLVEGVGGAHLCGVKVDFGFSGFGDALLVEVVHDADDVDRAVTAAEGEVGELLAGGGVFLGEGAVDHGDRLRGGRCPRR